jgi:hypothetical protein
MVFLIFVVLRQSVHRTAFTHDIANGGGFLTTIFNHG